ncbi:MAG: tetratricopeptide repeat protein [Nitrospira sp.]|nr:tetratricopeptide repeat protein [Nitrospira sp.]
MRFLQRHSLLIGVALLLGLMQGCGGAPPPVRPNLPPSESDLVLLTSAALCDRKADLLKKLPQTALATRSWGSGQEVVYPGTQSPSHGDESYFFDEDGLLVGAVFSFPSGLDLQPYPVLRRTLSLLKPSLEFYFNAAQLATKGTMDSSAIYETGDEKTTFEYLVTGDQNRPVLLMASFTIDPYARLFSPYRQEFLSRLKRPADGKAGMKTEIQGSEDKDPFASLQQFARGQTAQLAYCQEKNYDIAADAYQKAIAGGFANKVWLAEAHHRLGVALDAKGQVEKAKAEMLQSLAIRPNIPEVLNNLGTLHRKLGDKAAAMSLFEKAVVLRPNYAMARYNLAEAYEPVNPKRAIVEYETFLALVEGIPEEEGRIARVTERLKALKKP